MRNKKILLIIGVFVLAVAGIGTTVFLTSQKQDVRSRAQSNNSASSCQPPGTVTNVKIDYPSCQGSQCDLNSAICTWDTVTGATNFSYTITEVDSGNVIQNNSVASSTITVTFSVTQGKTYKCDVNATNACGASGGTGSDTLLCQTNALLTPTITVTPQPTLPPNFTPTPVPTSPPVVTPVATPAVIACGVSPCDATHACQIGLVCIQAVNGQSYCSQGAYTKACQQSPSVNSCCFAPPITPRPTPPPSGNINGTIVASGVTLLLLLGGTAMLVL